MKSTFFVLFVLFLGSSCQNKINPKRENKTLNNSLQKIKTSSSCLCDKGISTTKGEKPLQIFEFTNGHAVRICGYKDESIQEDENMLLSEFNIFDCLSGVSYVEFGATQTCRIKTYTDTLVIEELAYLPSGENWEWQLIQIAEQKIYCNGKDIHTSKLEPKIKLQPIDSILQNTFLNSLKKGEGFPNEWEEEIGKLVVLSLSGNEKAWEILQDYENFTGTTVDGAIAETWKEGISLVEWILK